MTTKQNRQLKILIVDDDEKILYAFEELLRHDGYSTITTTSAKHALTILQTNEPGLVYLDIGMPQLDGLEFLSHIKAQYASLPVIIITGQGTMQTAIKAMQLGAFDYLTKPLDINKIRDLTQKAMAMRTSIVMKSEESLRFDADVINRYELIGHSTIMQEVYKSIGSVASTPNLTSVIITGESGTGKELVGRAIHHNSSSSLDPFIAINCTALPESLLESELFGYEKGAFTGAGERKLGKFEIAKHGTIFLDEIGSLSPGLQQKLLRVIQEREFERVGGNDRIKVEARFIAATNENLDAEIQNHSFRKDLFFRLNVVAIHMPPLRDRTEDIPLLANYFLKKYSIQIKKRTKGFSIEAMNLLTSYSFPGNVRQLENVVERAVIFAKGEVIIPADLQEPLSPSTATSPHFPIKSSNFTEARENIVSLFEVQFVQEQLKKYHGNVTEAAKDSRMTRQNFQRLMKKHKINSELFR